MKFSLAFILIVAMLAYVSAQPLDDEVNEKGQEAILSRVRRATCDLLSIEAHGIAIHDAACAAHCILKKFKGGRCINGVCNCRK